MNLTPDDAASAGLTALPGPELVFGLIGAVGTDLALVAQSLAGHLERVGYRSHEIRVSKLLHSLDAYSNLLRDPPTSEYERVKAHMKAGTNLRERAGAGNILALMAVSEVRQLRRELSNGATDDERSRTPLPRTAYIIRSIKHPAEIDTLRDIYGRAFFVVSAYSPRSRRVSALATMIAESAGSANQSTFREKAEELIRTDEEEGAPLGQSVRESFPQGDVFVDARSHEGLDASLGRFVDAVFGNPFVTPTHDEFGMFHANAAALRSADLGRQVGAAITGDDGEIIAVGCNEVPKTGGGLYWTGSEPDHRDFQKGYDSATKFRDKLIAELSAKLLDAGWQPPEGTPRQPQQLAELFASQGIFQGTRLQNLLEYGRAVHAEMAAITDSARRGVSIARGTLYATTFPCHLCARHIISAGLRRVVYIEPYPKSAAEDLYDDSLAVDPEERPTSKVAFEPFVGISPTLYALLFRLVPSSRKDTRGNVKRWQAAKAEPRWKRFVTSYLLIEDRALGTVLRELFEQIGIRAVTSQPRPGGMTK